MNEEAYLLKRMWLDEDIRAKEQKRCEEKHTHVVADELNGRNRGVVDCFALVFEVVEMNDWTEDQETLLNVLVELPVKYPSDHHDRKVSEKDGKLLPLQFP